MIVGPVGIALISSPSSFILMLRSMVSYYLFMPMTTGFFSSYSFTRCWDLSWGNRPSGNALDQQMIQEQQMNLKGFAATITALLVGANCLIFLVEASNLDYAKILLYLSSILVIPNSIQMLFSTIWFMGYDLRRILHFIKTRLLWSFYHMPPPEYCWWILGRPQHVRHIIEESKEEQLPLTSIRVSE